MQLQSAQIVQPGPGASQTRRCSIRISVPVCSWRSGWECVARNRWVKCAKRSREDVPRCIFWPVFTLALQNETENHLCPFIEQTIKKSLLCSFPYTRALCTVMDDYWRRKRSIGRRFCYIKIFAHIKLQPKTFFNLLQESCSTELVSKFRASSN